MSENMIERVARAMRQHDCDEIQKRDGVIIPNWDSDPDLERRKAYLRNARAAIEAMRTPTDEQRNAYYELSHKTETMVDAHWERAIDAALSTPKERT